MNRDSYCSWTDGSVKGAILNELKKDLAQYEGVSSDIAVIADPANVTELCGTHDDILIPSSCLKQHCVRTDQQDILKE